ncbi:toxin YdaT domain-containing protein [Klebsiella quasipneumoniae]|uniref:toxin YdaT domain-containing protein n=1 Tax=Klebsiella quasipneumoniae TaxID=1463165 RepID=UPI002DBD8023|nr:toxin YdaT domain-containing protein [Klebsiella quasipneumoniae]MEB5814968.1 toxin YdaT domain-containing protein [Klebsiella quasipneumoniae]
MRSLTFQQNTGFKTGALIKRNQPIVAEHDPIRSAVRAWAAVTGQDVVSAYIVEEWRQQGGEEISFPDDISRARQKLFRYLDNPAESERYREYVRLLTPAIMAVLPLEYRHRLMPQDDILSRLSSAMKECAEAKQAVMLNAPEHQKLKEVSEGIASLFRLMPEQTGALMTIVSSMLGVM